MFRFIKKEYYVMYLNCGKEIHDILNTFNCICLLILNRFNKKIKILEIREVDFYE